MIGASFDALYRRLASAAEHYHALERSPETLERLADAHWELHLARRAMADERDRLLRNGAIYSSDDRRWLDGVGIEV